MNWLPEHSAALRELRTRGMSYSEIADTINARFNTAYTRNAALSRGQRMGLANLEPPAPSLPKQPSIDRADRAGAGSIAVAGLKAAAEPRADLFRWPKPPLFEKVVLPELRCVEITPRRLSFLELDHGDCRYPYGGDGEDEPITFCGHPRRPGSSYCTPHFHLSRDPELSAKPVLNEAWLRAVGAA